jgi:hypothetical protein
MLVFTNRDVTPGDTPQAFGNCFEPLGSTLGMAEVVSTGRTLRLARVQPDVGDDDARKALTAVLTGDRPVLLYLHGNANTPLDCFRRCLRLQTLYDVAVIGFSWPSEGLLCSGEEQPRMPAGSRPAGDAGLAKLVSGRLGQQSLRGIRMRYGQAKQNAWHSTSALERFLRLLGTATLQAQGQPLTVAAHSLGAHLLQHTLGLGSTLAALAPARNIVLLAPCCRANGHGAWLQQLHPQGQVFVTYNLDDTVLLGARFADKEWKLGSLPGEMLQQPQVRYVDFKGAPTGPWGHSYFVTARAKMPVRPGRLFRRIFRGERDMAAHLTVRDPRIYLHCDPGLHMCQIGEG